MLIPWQHLHSSSPVHTQDPTQTRSSALRRRRRRSTHQSNKSKSQRERDDGSGLPGHVPRRPYHQEQAPLPSRALCPPLPLPRRRRSLSRHHLSGAAHGLRVRNPADAQRRDHHQALHLQSRLRCLQRDIKDLFSEVGDVKRYSINYDRSGRSKGTAEVVFSRKSDALAAVKRYNNVHLDGKPMKLELIGTNIEPPPPAIFGFAAPAGYFNFPPKRSGRGWPRGRGGFGGRGRGHVGHGRGRGDRGSQKVSAEDLDADLDKYHAERMQMS